MKPKKRFEIVERTRWFDSNTGHESWGVRRVGFSFAVSAKQAVSNFCFRTNRQAYSEVGLSGDNGYSVWIVAEEF